MEKCLLKIFAIGQCYFLCLCFINNFGKTEAAGNECELGGGARGECVPLSACAQYVTLLKESTTTELGLKLTQERRCGLEGNNVKVCCPTVTQLPNPDPNFRTKEDNDYVDELPEPGECGRHVIEWGPYVWNAQPVKTPPFLNLSSGIHKREVTSSSLRPEMAEESSTETDDSSNTSGTSLFDRPFSVAGGQPVVRWELAQWMALLAYKRSPSMWECGGSIITKWHVLTAAHCIRDSLYVVRVGELDLAQTKKKYNPIDFYIKKKIPHEHYSKYHNDIAILVVDGTIPIAEENITPICLPEAGFPYEKVPISTFITGWGETEKNDRPSNLQYAYLNILDQEACRSAYSSEALTIDERVFCAGDHTAGRDACNGDSGGPLIGKYTLPSHQKLFYYQLGIISYGYRCSAQRFTGVYTNVTHFLPWIREKVTGKTAPRQWIVTTTEPFLLDWFGNNTAVTPAAPIEPIAPEPS